MYYRTKAVIDLDSIEYNFKNTKAKLGGKAKLLAVIKADAYGHGAIEIAKLLDDECDFFGVACVDEALELISANIKTPILILGYVSPFEYKEIVKNNIRIPIFSLEDAKALSTEAVKQNKTIPFHFCIDTGMSRIGFQVNNESADLCKKIAALKGLKTEGLFSHFATADENNLSKALKQQKLFDSFAQMLSERGIDIPIKHINNSAGIMNFEKKYDMCRMGIILYGLYPSHEVDKSLLSIKPAMKWTTHISHIKTLPAGREISYGGTYKTEKDTTVATIPVGYADGYPRCLSNTGCVLIGGKRAPILGRVCMDQFMVDISEIKNVEIGDEAVLIGEQNENNLSMEEVSEKAHSFNYEMPCRISRRVPRVYIKNGKTVNSVKYI